MSSATSLMEPFGQALSNWCAAEDIEISQASVLEPTWEDVNHNNEAIKLMLSI